MRTLGALVLAAAALCCAACTQDTPVRAEGRRRLVRIVVDTTTSTPLAREYARLLPDVEIRLIDALGSGGTAAAIQQGSADLGFVLADVAYFANLQAQRGSTSQLGELRGVAALQTAPVHVLARPGVTISQITRLPAPRVGTNDAFSKQFILAKLVLGAYGLDIGTMRGEPLAADPLAAALATGAVDVAFVTAYYPAQSVAAATTRGARILPIDDNVAQRLRSRYPFVRRVSIPANTYAGQPESVRTVGVDRLLVCRSDLDELLVHDLTQRFIEALPEVFLSRRASARLIDIEQASATPIPLHKGAAQYYRERELTP